MKEDFKFRQEVITESEILNELAKERAARRIAEEASRAKDEILAVVSHELRSPLNAMVGWMRILRTERLDEATFARGLEIVDRNIMSQAQLLDDLLDVSRIVSGRLRLELQPLQLDAIVASAVESIRPTAESKGVDVETDIAPNVGLVNGDPNRLQQVLWNLLSNAVKFTPKGGKVRAALRRVHDAIEVAIADTGQGIAPDFLPHVFDRFRQADAKITRRVGGLGLGLAIVRHIVELHGGTVRAESDGLGKGSIFTARLPVPALGNGDGDAGLGRHLRRRPVAFDCPPSLEGVGVLVVDDEPDTRDLLKVALEKCRAAVRTVGSAGEALRVLDEWLPSVVVSDIGMPGTDGYELIRTVRARGLRIPAIALSAFVRSEERLQALAAGYEVHIGKPVEPAELVLVIDRLVRLTEPA